MSSTCCLATLRFLPSAFSWAWTLTIAVTGICSTSKDGLGLFLHLVLTVIYLINMALGPRGQSRIDDSKMYSSIWGRFSSVALVCWVLYGLSFLYFMWTHTPFGFKKNTSCVYDDYWFGFIGIAAMTLIGILHGVGVVISLCFASTKKKPSFSIQSPLLKDGHNLQFVDSL